MSQLTIVIPSYGRHKFLIRGINFWSNKNVEVVIVDGSSKTLFNSYSDNLPSNINYYHLPIGFLNRLEFASNLIKTKYCILLADDEFFIPSALSSAIKQLELYKEIVACCGQSISVWPEPQSSISNDFSLTGHVVYPERKNYSLNQNSSRYRMIEHIKNYSPTGVYSVMRSQTWKQIISIISSKEFNAFAIFELQFELALAFQ